MRASREDRLVEIPRDRPCSAVGIPIPLVIPVGFIKTVGCTQDSNSRMACFFRPDPEQVVDDVADLGASRRTIS